MWPDDGVPLAGMGCMRLSTDPDRDEARGIAVLHAALDRGITLLDTADAYCHDEHDTGHNERLIARALAAWRGDRSRIRVATKGGLTRPRGALDSGRPREASRRGLRGEPARARCRSDRALSIARADPRVPFATSVRALAALKRDGVIAAIGLCNVTVGQIEEARRITEIASVQVELSLVAGRQHPRRRGRILRGARHPAARLSSARRAAASQTRDRRQGAGAVARRHAPTPFEIAIAWLRDLSRVVVPSRGLAGGDGPVGRARFASR